MDVPCRTHGMMFILKCNAHIGLGRTNRLMNVSDGRPHKLCRVLPGTMFNLQYTAGKLTVLIWNFAKTTTGKRLNVDTFAEPWTMPRTLAQPIVSIPLFLHTRRKANCESLDKSTNQKCFSLEKFCKSLVLRLSGVFCHQTSPIIRSSLARIINQRSLQRGNRGIWGKVPPPPSKEIEESPLLIKEDSFGLTAFAGNNHRRMRRTILWHDCQIFLL